MTQADWLITGERTKRPVVVAPGTDDAAAAAAAVKQVDAALDGFAGPVPGWYRAVERLGYWWYPVCVVVGLVLAFALAPARVEWQISLGLLVGLVGARGSGMVFWFLARLQARGSSGFGSTAKALAAAADVARPSDADTGTEVAAVLAKDPALESRVHLLVWQAADEQDGARQQLDALWEKADPEGAARRAAHLAEVHETTLAMRAARTK